MIYCVEHLFICSFAIFISSSVRCLVRSLAHYRLWLFSCCWILKVLCIFWVIVFCEMPFAKYFSQSLSGLLILLIVSLAGAEVFNFNKVQLINYIFHNVDWEKVSIRCFIIEKGLIWEKERVATQCTQTRQPCAHSGLCARAGSVYRAEVRSKEGEIRTRELPYKHRVLPAGCSPAVFLRLSRVWELP